MYCFKFGVAAVVALAVAGCSDLPSVEKVSGKVTYRDAPVEGADVTFISQTPGEKSAYDVTDAQGNYTLQTYYDSQNQLAGAIPGKYRVMVQKMEKLTPEEYAKAMESGGSTRGKHLLPKKYAHGVNTPLEEEVKAGGEYLLNASRRYFS
jgi:hypothetical protein